MTKVYQKKAKKAKNLVSAMKHLKPLINNFFQKSYYVSYQILILKKEKQKYEQ